MAKEALIKARVSKDIKDAVARIAQDRGESEAVIVREALKDLVLKAEQQIAQRAGPVKYPPHRDQSMHAEETGKSQPSAESVKKTAEALRKKLRKGGKV